MFNKIVTLLLASYILFTWPKTGDVCLLTTIGQQRKIFLTSCATDFDTGNSLGMTLSGDKYKNP